MKLCHEFQMSRVLQLNWHLSIYKVFDGLQEKLYELQFSRMHIVIISKTTKSHEFQKVLLSNISSIHFRQTAKIPLPLHPYGYIYFNNLFMSQILISFMLMYSFTVLFLQYKDSASTQNASLHTNFGSHTDPSTFFLAEYTDPILGMQGKKKKNGVHQGGNRVVWREKIESGLREDLIMVFFFF